MPAPLVPNTVMVEMLYNHLAVRVENVFHVRCPGEPTSANLTSIFNVFDSWERNTARLYRANQVSWVLYSLKSLHSVGAPILEGAVLPSAVGGNLSTISIPSLTLAVKLTTGKSGRSYRGRIFWCGLDRGAVIGDQTVTQSYVNNIVTAVNTLRTSLATAGFPLVVASKYSGVDPITRRAIPRAVGITTDVTGVSADNYADHQRRRRPQSGL